MEYKVNEYQTPITEELFAGLPDEVKEQFFEFYESVEYIKILTDPNRPHAKDLPRDNEGKIIVDITHPHILDDMDYFRQPALHFMKYQCYTKLKPNSNPNSEYRKYWAEERRRCLEGYVRESDGEWVTGMMYWFMNYTPMMINVIIEGTKTANRVESFPLTWEGIYWRFHYLYQARMEGKNAIELAKRSVAKSYTLASIMTHNLILGENPIMRKRNIVVLAASSKEYIKEDKDGSLSKFVPMLNFVLENTAYPKLLRKKSSNDMSWVMGYEQKGVIKGSGNTVMAVSTKDDSDKLRGKRGWILYEEMGNYKNLLSVYDSVMRSTMEGNYSYALQYLVGTSNNKEADFQAAKTLLYKPEGYNIKALPNVYDRKGEGKKLFGFFFPAYVNRLGCYDKNGNSDVVKALIEILMARWEAKSSADPQTVLTRIAEDPITPAEAMLKVKAAFFPVQQINERIRQLEFENILDTVLVGTLVNVGNEIKFVPTNDNSIRHYPVENTELGAIEIYSMPEKINNKIPEGRYIAGHDPVDNDQAESTSLSSSFVFDTWTDEIVAEYTGRQPYADDNFEILRKLCIFYNAKCLYEAHPYDQKVRLPDGTTKLWKDVKVGDTLFAPNGTTTKVIDIPVDGEDDIYKLTLEDGRTVEASSNHIWNVLQLGKKEMQNITTKEMFDAGCINKHRQRKFYIPESGAVDYPYKEVPIDPYTMGLLIAEGAFTKFKKGKYEKFKKRIIQISASKKDMEFYKTKIPYPVKYIGTKGYSWHLYIDSIDLILDDLGLLHCNSQTKFIPDLYLYNSKEVRLELLKGLMDGDGCTTHKGACVYITTSKKLSEDVKTLCRSLGIKAYNNKGREEGDFYFTTSGNTYHCNASYRVAIAATMPIFNLPRKIEKQHIYNPDAVGSKARGFLYKTAIKNIEYVGRKQCKCVTVDREDGLYLIGDYIVTHNCNKKGCFAYFKKMNCVEYLADTPQYLRDKNLVKYSAWGSNQKGVNASNALNNYANGLIKDWLNRPVTMTITSKDGEIDEFTTFNLFKVKSRALLDELVAFRPEVGNYDRIRSLGMVMLLREATMIECGGDLSKLRTPEKVVTKASDPYFQKNWEKYKNNGKSKKRQVIINGRGQ